jgi:hypothetical protein
MTSPSLESHVLNPVERARGASEVVIAHDASKFKAHLFDPENGPNRRHRLAPLSLLCRLAVCGHGGVPRRPAFARRCFRRHCPLDALAPGQAIARPGGNRFIDSPLDQRSAKVLLRPQRVVRAAQQRDVIERGLAAACVGLLVMKLQGSSLLAALAAIETHERAPPLVPRQYPTPDLMWNVPRPPARLARNL